MILVACLLLACRGQDAPISDEEREARAVDKYIALLSSVHFEERLSGARGVAEACCQFEPDAWRPARARVRPQACRALERTVSSEREAWVLNGLNSFVTPACAISISPRRFLSLLEMRGIELDWLVGWSQLTEPTQEMASTVLRLTRDLDHRDDRRFDLLRMLGVLGEPDLSPVVETMSDADPRMRQLGVDAIASALLEGPLDLPDVQRVLEKLARDPDQTIAPHAEATAAQYRYRFAHADADAEAYLAGKDISLGPLHTLGVRRLFCGSEKARAALERAAGGDAGPAAAVVANRALALRAKRCLSRRE